MEESGESSGWETVSEDEGGDGGGKDDDDVVNDDMDDSDDGDGGDADDIQDGEGVPEGKSKSGGKPAGGKSAGGKSTSAKPSAKVAGGKSSVLKSSSDDGTMLTDAPTPLPEAPPPLEGSGSAAPAATSSERGLQAAPVDDAEMAEARPAINTPPAGEGNKAEAHDEVEVYESAEEDGAAAAADEAASACEAASKAARAERAAAAGEVAVSPSEASAIADYAEHEQFFLDESDDSWTWHHYYDGGSSSSATLPPSFARTAQKQWKLLRAGLPEGVYVAASTERVDLMRAFITGPPGTPYHDAVFVFDLRLPAEFPQQPPSVHYLSHGQRINPNLYENGKVCLSLLGTWTGHQSCELWNPQTSSVLQVLVSIQGLVLCEMPYFNEAGYDKQLGTYEGEHHARRYNEGVLLLSLKVMITSIRHASPPFERLTRLHFLTVRRRVFARLATLLELRTDAPPPPPGVSSAIFEPATGAADGSTSGGGSSGGGSSGGGGSSVGGGSRAGGSDGSSSGGASSSGAEASGCGSVGDESGDRAGGSSGGGKPAGPVAKAQLAGVLNEMPSLGFLHSLHRQLPDLSAAFDSIATDELDHTASDETPSSVA